MAIVLAPCIFCDSAENLKAILDRNCNHVIRCEECGCTGPEGYTKKEAIKKWNSRKTKPNSCEMCSNAYCEWCGKRGCK